jgi:eukaryotic-like serine/threonine-protein kinase
VPLDPGHQLAHYEILEPIGKGGMGEVYPAKDSKLGRDVAIKILPEEFAQDEERLRRFQREAKVLASLNHPNIASIYGLEESVGTHYLVLELVAGETLADRISRGPIPVDEALEIAKKIAEALEEAHEQGIVHRDLKPANVKLTPDDRIKVLDFGLAKAFLEEQPEADGSTSPTLTRDATRLGVILGTAAYMSPEQAKGKRVDKRADVWAFGAVLHEMLTGRQAFGGSDISETLASVLKTELNLDSLPAATPAAMRTLLRRCLQRDLVSRLPHVGVARLEIEEIQRAPPGTEADSSRPVTTGFGRRRSALLVGGGVLAGALLSGLATHAWMGGRSVALPNWCVSKYRHRGVRRSMKDHLVKWWPLRLTDST